MGRRVVGNRGVEIIPEVLRNGRIAPQSLHTCVLSGPLTEDWNSPDNVTRPGAA